MMSDEEYIAYIKEMSGFNAFWTPEDDDFLRTEIFQLRSDLISVLDSAEDSLDFFDHEMGYISCNLTDDIVDSFDDTTKDIDDGFRFSLEDPFSYIKYD